MISEVIAWKFNSQPGMCCKEIDGVIQIVDFPGCIPSQPDQDLWTQEYNDWVASGGLLDAENDQMITDFISQNRNIMKAIVIALNKGTLIPGAGVTGAELKAIIKAEL